MQGLERYIVPLQLRPTHLTGAKTHMQSPRAPVATVVAPPSVVDSEKNREYYYRRADRNDLTSLTLCFNAICVSIFLFSVQPHRWHVFPPSCLLHSVRPLDLSLIMSCPVLYTLVLCYSSMSSLYCLLFSFHVFSLLFLLFFCLLCSPLRLTSLHFLGIPCPCLCNHLLTLFCYLLIYTSLVHSYDILFSSFTLFHSPLFSSHGMIVDSSFNN